MTDREKPGVALWATAGLVAAPFLYVLSLGPATRLYWVTLDRPEWLRPIMEIYAPLVWLHSYGPDWIQYALAWYCDICTR
jgi:hypothetical protein